LIDEWTFDVFALSDVSAGSPLRYLGIDLLNRYGVIHKFKVDETRLYFFFFFNLTFFRRTYNEIITSLCFHSFLVKMIYLVGQSIVLRT
jgi:hypothetical protein